jgi:RNA-directed DNA polymerase
MLKAVERHTDQKWILLYVRRWLTAPLRRQDGTLTARDRGTPQGSSISPVLANLYLHYAMVEGIPDLLLVSRTFRPR